MEGAPVNQQSTERLNMNQSNQKTASAAISSFEEIKSKIEAIKDAGQDKLDNASENYPETDAGQALQSEIESLEAAIQSIEEAIGNIDEACNS